MKTETPMTADQIYDLLEMAINQGRAYSGNAARFSKCLRLEWVSRGNRRAGKIYKHLLNIGDDYPTVYILARLIETSDRKEEWVQIVSSFLPS